MKDLSFDTAQLLQAATLAGINPRDIPASSNPWTWDHPLAKSWQMAFRTINPSVAQEAEIAHGPSISLALQAAMEGHAPWTNDLRSELAVKRPLEHRAMANAAVDDAIAGIQEARAAKPPAGPNSPLYPNSFSANWPRAVRRQRAASGLKLA